MQLVENKAGRVLIESIPTALGFPILRCMEGSIRFDKLWRDRCPHVVYPAFPDPRLP
jgi:hypothetical protein